MIRSDRTAALALVTALLSAACGDLPGKPDLADVQPAPRDVLDFDALYGQNCAGCHGADGTLGAARPLDDALYLAFVGEQRLAKIVNEGMADTLMPAFGGASALLTEAQVQALVDGMYQRWGGRPGEFDGADVPSYSVPSTAPDDLAESVSRGETVFATFCGGCHEDRAGGVTDPAFLALVSDQSLRTTVVCGRPDLDKPDWRSNLDDRALSASQIVDVVNWLASHRTAFPGRPYALSAQERIHEDD